MALSNLVYIIAIGIAECIYAYRLHHRRYFMLRLAVGLIISVAIALFLPAYNNAWYACAVYVLLFSVRLLFMKFAYKEPWINLLFCGLAAYTTQHLAYQFTTLITILIRGGQGSLFGIYFISVIDFSEFDLEMALWFLVYIICYFTMYFLAYALFAVKIKKDTDLKIKNKSLLFLIGICLLVEILLNSLTVYTEETQTFLNSAIRCVYVGFFCVVLLQWQFGLIYTQQLESDLDFTRRVLQKEKEQYRFTKENIDMINMKCHDMRHQIYNIRNMQQLNQDALNDIEKAISVYDSSVKAGNSALDVLLTEKNLYCEKNNIDLTYMADGECLDFMQESDIYSLFGNAIDNAIEAVIKLSDDEKRIIGVKVCAVGNMITVNIHNFYEYDIRFNHETGLPETSKKNKNIHGYGMKSIRYIVEKYDGSLSVKAKDGIFRLDILFPWKKREN